MPWSTFTIDCPITGGFFFCWDLKIVVHICLWEMSIYGRCLFMGGCQMAGTSDRCPLRGGVRLRKVSASGGSTVFRYGGKLTLTSKGSSPRERSGTILATSSRTEDISSSSGVRLVLPLSLISLSFCPLDSLSSSFSEIHVSFSTFKIINMITNSLQIQFFVHF